MDNVNLRKYMGDVNKAKIEETFCYETLDDEKAIIKTQFILVLSDGAKILLANPEYLKFLNSVSGIKVLENSDMPKKYKDIILNFWNK
jgi:hypothetical protein